ncbi:DUF1467 family protein [Rhodobacterales bacterium HKCCE2091]|nr:DUF1467 family protein [Rhodobacterales bacterium HKCCE2091]
MNVVTGIVLYAIIWFLTLFVVLPFRMTTQGEAGDRVPGTHASAPSDASMKRRFLVTTAIASAVWAVVAGIILSGVVSVSDFDLFTRFGMGDPR